MRVELKGRAEKPEDERGQQARERFSLPILARGSQWAVYFLKSEPKKLRQIVNNESRQEWRRGDERKRGRRKVRADSWAWRGYVKGVGEEE